MPLAQLLRIAIHSSTVPPVISLTRSIAWQPVQNTAGCRILQSLRRVFQLGMNMVPTRLFFTQGVGKHKERLTSFELALRDACIAAQNLVRVSRSEEHTS